ncbi:VOC family protein [Paraburkholderia oxyphila]|uniref:VOC family protein n=1 Tax=Paraburkholderia oxyphila TaxID=614212 RepID=UPI0004812053|nr:VOC family protein [Paraburkholderia oxyphila]
MSLSLDHIVIRVQHLEPAIADFSELGFTVQRGGTHADGATHNALIGFEDGSYLELIAFLRDAREHKWWDAGHRVGDGYVDFALLPGSVGKVIETAASRGLHYEGPIPGGRTRPDGTRIEWQLGRPASKDLPFLCGDLTPRFLRVAEGNVRKHANGAQGVASIAVAVNDIDASLRRYRSLLGDSFDPHVATVPGEGVRLATLPVGSTTFALFAPRAGTNAATTANEQGDSALLEARLRTQLARRGEGVFGVTIRTAHAANARALPDALTHQATLELVRS